MNSLAFVYVAGRLVMDRNNTAHGLGITSADFLIRCVLIALMIFAGVPLQLILADLICLLPLTYY